MLTPLFSFDKALGRPPLMRRGRVGNPLRNVLNRRHFRTAQDPLARFGDGKLLDISVQRRRIFR